jgi:glycine hydroxymethyltransferase
LADIAHPAGLVAAGLHPSPIPHCHFVTSTTHKTLRGPRGGLIMAAEEVSKKVGSTIFPGIQGGPLCHVIAAKAVAFGEALQPEFKEYGRQIIANTQTLAEGLMEKGFNLISGGTDNHLVLVDLRNKNITGKEAEAALEKAGMTVNKNMVPFDDKSPFVTSGMRIGTPAITTRGMKEAEMTQIATWIDRVIQRPTDETVLATTRKEIGALCEDFPLYADLLD